MKQVIIVPETDKYKHPVSHENVVWINSKHGNPNLTGHDAQYLAPYWITEDFRGVDRIYHIASVSKNEKGTTIIKLGNSFIIDKPWDNMRQTRTRKFEYHSLSEFGFEELEKGLLKRV